MPTVLVGGCVLTIGLRARRFLVFVVSRPSRVLSFFFFNDTATTEIYTLSLHDALPISRMGRASSCCGGEPGAGGSCATRATVDRKSTRLNSSHGYISYAVFCLKKKKHDEEQKTQRNTHRQTSTALRTAPSTRKSVSCL